MPATSESPFSGPGEGVRAAPHLGSPPGPGEFRLQGTGSPHLRSRVKRPYSNSKEPPQSFSPARGVEGDQS
jgi:hypothetical protein